MISGLLDDVASSTDSPYRVSDTQKANASGRHDTAAHGDTPTPPPGESDTASDASAIVMYAMPMTRVLYGYTGTL